MCLSNNLAYHGVRNGIIMNQLIPPRPLSFEGNVAENWRRCIQQFRLYINATGIDKKPLQKQCLTLLTVAGEETLKIFNTLGLTDADKVKIDVVIRKFKEVWIVADIKIFSETTRHFLKTCFDRNFCHLQFKSVQSTELNI